VLVFNLLQSVSIMNNALTVFREHLVEGIVPNVERMRDYVEHSVGVVTAINPHVGYETAARLAREAILTHQPVRDIILRDGVLTEEQLNIILDPYQMTTPGIAGETDRNWRPSKRESEDDSAVTS
jgi:aspartate ammonia-lyase